MADLPNDAPMAAKSIHHPLPAPAQFPVVPMTRRDAMVDMLIMFASLAAFAVFTVFTDLQTWLSELIPSGGLYLWVLINGLLAIVTVYLVVKVRGQDRTTIGLGPVSIKTLVLGTLAAVPICYLAGIIFSLSAILLSGQGLMETAQERTSFLAYISNVPLSWVIPVVMFVGLYEEILFRGFLLPRLMAVLPGPVPAIAAASIIFGLVHFTQGPVFMVQTGGVGMVLAIVAWRTHSIWPGILAHATIDGVSLFISIFLLPEIQKMLETVTSAPASMPN